MPANWTAEAIGKMHLLKITSKALSEKIGWTNEYVSMIFNGKRNPKGAEEKINLAIMQIAEEKGLNELLLPK